MLVFEEAIDAGKVDETNQVSADETSFTNVLVVYIKLISPALFRAGATPTASALFIACKYVWLRSRSYSRKPFCQET